LVGSGSLSESPEVSRIFEDRQLYGLKVGILLGEMLGRCHAKSHSKRGNQFNGDWVFCENIRSLLYVYDGKILLKKCFSMPSIAAHAFYSSIQEADTGVWQVQG
jgi:hypothetical protein